MSDATAAATTATAGGLLRDARQASGMHIAALAVALKVPVSKLEALEADNYALLPDTVFVRALASSVCRTLKIDPRPVMELLPRSESPRLAADSAGINAPVKGSASRMSTSSAPSWSGSKSVSVVVAVLLAGAAGLIYYPRDSAEPPSHPASPVAQPVVPPVAHSGTEGSGSGAELPPMSAEARPAAGATPATGDAPAQAASLPPAVAATAEPAASASPLPPGVLVLRARGESWVQVKDSTGAVVLQRSLHKGETVPVPGVAPFAVVVGRADVTDVLVRGVPFEISAVSRENVARFEVK